MLRPRLLVLPALAAVALTACAADPEPDAGPSGTELAAQVRTAATDTASTGSSKLSLSSTTAIGGQDVTLQGEGAFDYAARNGQLTFAVPGSDGTAAGGGTIEQRIIGPDLYLTLPQQPGVFYRLKVLEVAGTSLGSSADPTASLTALQTVESVDRVGTEQVRGVQATRYEGEYDASDAIDRAQGAAKQVLLATLSATSRETVPFSVFLDGEGRLVRFEQEIELPATPQTGGEVLTSRTVLELFDFGTAVVVTPPAAAKVRDGAPLLAALRAALPRPTPSAGPSGAAASSPGPSASPRASASPGPSVSPAAVPAPSATR